MLKCRGASGSAFSSRSDSDPQSAKMLDSDLLRESDQNPTQKLTTKVLLGIYLYFKYFKSILVSGPGGHIFFTKTVKIDLKLSAPVYYVPRGINKEYFQSVL